MDVKKLNDDLQNFWDSEFAQLEPMTIPFNEINDTDKLDKYFHFMGDNAKRLLDIGTGYGFSLVTAKVLGSKCEYALGIDTSKSAINFIKQTCLLSNIKGIDYEVSDSEYLKKLPNESFDGIICSNVLDVIPDETSDEIIKEINRILVKGGYLLLKFNFYLTADIISKIKMQNIGNNYYVLNGILRGVNHTTEEWLARFSNFNVIKIDSYPRIPNGPEDRVLLLQKI
jgi:ubiquinone/menaquinone biosynthesis C-methylase UbiE